MKYSILSADSGRRSDKLSNGQSVIEKNKGNNGLSVFKEGRQITGTVVSVGELVTLDFYGQKVSASGSMLPNVKPGDVKTFEVVKMSRKEIELKLLEGSLSSLRSFKAAMVKDTDWETIRTKKEKAAQKTEKEAVYKDTKEYLEGIASRLTELDCELLEEEGFAIDNYTVQGLHHALSRIKNDGTRESRNTGQGRNGSSGVLPADNAHTYGHMTDSYIMKRLKEENLPAALENVSRVARAMEFGMTLTKLDDKAMHYLIARDAEPTVTNIYKALYSGTTINLRELSSQTWSDLQGQVREIIKEAGFDVTEDTLGDARWLVENGLALTPETLTYKTQLEELKTSANGNDILNKLLAGIQEGLSPAEVPLIPLRNEAERIVTDLKSIRPETVSEAVRTGEELTIKNLIGLQEQKGIRHTAETDEKLSADQELLPVNTHTEEEVRAAQSGSIDSKEESDGSQEGEAAGQSYEEIKARRQLEEIRLRMTLEAAARLERKGFKVETQQLGRVVEELRKLEENYYGQYLKEADAEVSEASLQTLRETTRSIEQLKYIPAFILGSTLAQRSEATVPGLLGEGLSLQTKLDKAGEAYETLMTIPNREYGDSIKKAFVNMDSLLRELNIDTTPENQRAVRILGYNQMDITQETVNQVKAYDLQVNTLLKNLHPGVTVRMIKEGINPLDMPVSELNKLIDNIKEKQGITTEDRFSTYLRQLEKTEGITAEERREYIGIYRLLYNVEKSDGAVLGAVIKAGREVTLEHLLTAVQTGRRGRVDTLVGDEFGLLQGLTGEKESIAGQLSGFTAASNQKGSERQTEEQAQQARIEEQTEYMDRILKEIMEEISSPGQMALLSHQRTEGQSVWECIRELPAEKLLRQLQSSDSQESTLRNADLQNNGLQKENTQMQEPDTIYAQRVQEVRELCRTAEQAIRFLNDYQMPGTPANIMLANQVLSGGESAIKRYFKLRDEKIIEKSEDNLKELNDLSDTIYDMQSMNERYSQMEADAGAALKQIYSEGKLDRTTLAELKNIGQQMTFLKALAEKEYYVIPIETESGITNINLTILRGTQASGKAAVTVWSEQLGNIKADFDLKGKSLAGLITGDSRYGLEELKQYTDRLEEAAAESDVDIKQLDYCLQHKEADTYGYNTSNTADAASDRRGETERTLYRIAKAFIFTIRSAEKAAAEKTIS